MLGRGPILAEKAKCPRREKCCQAHRWMSSGGRFAVCGAVNPVPFCGPRAIRPRRKRWFRRVDEPLPYREITDRGVSLSDAAGPVVETMVAFGSGAVSRGATGLAPRSELHKLSLVAAPIACTLGALSCPFLSLTAQCLPISGVWHRRLKLKACMRLILH